MADLLLASIPYQRQVPPLRLYGLGRDCGQFDRKAGSAVEWELHTDVSAMQLDDLARDV